MHTECLIRLCRMQYKLLCIPLVPKSGLSNKENNDYSLNMKQLVIALRSIIVLSSLHNQSSLNM